MNSQNLERKNSVHYYLSNTMNVFENLDQNSSDKNLTTEERIQIYKTLAFNFFDDNTFFLSYSTKINQIPHYDYVRAQFGFINCKNVEEKHNLLMIYKTCLEKCYPDLFVFKPLQILYEYFCKDTIADFILFSYGRIKYTDRYFYWFLENQNIVKHNLNYDYITQKKREIFHKPKNVSFTK